MTDPLAQAITATQELLAAIHHERTARDDRADAWQRMYEGGYTARGISDRMRYELSTMGWGEDDIAAVGVSLANVRATIRPRR